MIICGFPGIGKTTLTMKYPHFVDLESSSFKIDNNRFDNWVTVYAQVAMHLSSTHTVLTSCHKEVRDALHSAITSSSDNTNIYALGVIYPTLELKDAWLERLYTRYTESKLCKDRLAYEYMKDHYDTAIADIESDKRIDRIRLTNMDYDLKSILTDYEAFITDNNYRLFWNDVRNGIL